MATHSSSTLGESRFSQIDCARATDARSKNPAHTTWISAITLRQFSHNHFFFTRNLRLNLYVFARRRQKPRPFVITEIPRTLFSRSQATPTPKKSTMGNWISRPMHLTGTCHELGHTWNSSCLYSQVELFFFVLFEGVKLYLPLYLVRGNCH